MPRGSNISVCSQFLNIYRIIFIYTDFIQGCERETGCQDLDSCTCMPAIDVQDLCSVNDSV